MAQAARSAGRKPGSVRLVAVSKTKPVDMVRRALAAGQMVFGENYVQESQDKIPEIGPGPEWHFIGHLQSNKAKTAAALFQVIQTVDRLKLAKALDRHARELGKTVEVLLQVNLGREPQKFGCAAQDAPALAQATAGMESLRLKGLMTMPPFFDDPERARPYFEQLRELAQRLEADLPPVSMTELSMGMSGDFETAIAFNATHIRIGTAIFSQRPA